MVRSDVPNHHADCGSERQPGQQHQLNEQEVQAKAP